MAPKRKIQSVAVAHGDGASLETAGKRAVGGASVAAGRAAAPEQEPADYTPVEGVCSMCSGTPQEKAWPKFSVKKSKGKEPPSAAEKKKAVGDRCLECHDLYEKCLKGTYSWSEACVRRSKDQAFADSLSQGARVASGDLEKAWAAAELGRLTRVGVVVRDHGLFLSKKEFEDYCGHSPEDCKIQAITAMNTKGESCKGYAVADPQRPYRTFEAVACSFDYARSVTMAPGQHVLPTMAKDHLNKLRTDRANSKDLPKNVLTHKLYTKEELKDRAARAALDQSMAKADGGSDDESAGESSEEVVWEGEKPKQVAAAETPKKRSGRATAAAATAAATGTIASGRKSSVFGGSDMADDDEEKTDPRQKSANHWMMAVNLQKVMSGIKLGREEGFANNCVERLSDPKTRNPNRSVSAAKRLQMHLNLAQIAKSVAPQRLPTMPASELAAAVAALQEAEVEWPSVTKRALLQRRVHDLTQQVLDGSSSSLTSLLAACRPWRASDNDGEFDPTNPRVTDLEGDTDELIAVSTKFVIKNLLQELVVLGAEKASQVLMVCDGCLAYFDEEIPADADDVVERWLCDLTTCWRAFQALLRPSILDASMEADMRAIKERGTREKGVLAFVKDTLVTNEFYKEQLKQWELSAPHMKSCGKIISRIYAEIKDLDVAKEEAVDWAKQALNDMMACKVKLRQGACDDLSAALEVEVYKLAQAQQAQGATAAKLQRLEAIMLLAVQAFPKNPRFRTEMDNAREGLKKVDTASRIGDFLGELTAATDSAKKKNGGLALADIENVSKHASACQGIEIEVDDKLLKVLQDFVPSAIRALAVSVKDHTAAASIGHLDSVVNAFTHEKLEGYKKDISVLRTLVDAIEAHDAWEKLGATVDERVEQDDGLAKVKMIIVAEQTLANQCKGNMLEPTRSAAQGVLDKLGKLRQDIAGRVIEQSAAELQVQLDMLKLSAGGSTEGKLWYADVDTADWDKLFARARETVCEMSGERHVATMVAVEKVDESLQRYYELFGEEPAPGEASSRAQVKQTLALARATKVHGLLFCLFRDYTGDKVNLKRKVARVMAMAGNEGVMPSDLLPLVAEKVSDTMNYKFA